MSDFSVNNEGRYGDSGVVAQITLGRRVRWVRDGEVIREPGPNQDMAFEPGFVIGGKRYRYLKDLTTRKIDPDGLLYRDIHGRYVLDMPQRYPIFDSYDALYENRYYHWYFILEDGRMSMVYSDDGAGKKIIEDIEMLPETPYSLMRLFNYVDRDGFLRLKRPNGEVAGESK